MILYSYSSNCILTLPWTVSVIFFWRNWSQVHFAALTSWPRLGAELRLRRFVGCLIAFTLLALQWPAVLRLLVEWSGVLWSPHLCNVQQYAVNLTNSGFWRLNVALSVAKFDSIVAFPHTKQLKHSSNHILYNSIMPAMYLPIYL